MNARQIFSEASRIKVATARPDWIGLQLPPTTDARHTVMGYVRAEISNLTGDLGEQLSLAIDELLRNAVEHGCQGNGQGAIEFTLIRTPRMIFVQVRDSGPGFVLSAVKHAAINNPPEEPLRHAELRSEQGMRPGGFGIMLVREIADELIYSEAGNEVVLVKYLKSFA